MNLKIKIKNVKDDWEAGAWQATLKLQICDFWVDNQKSYFGGETQKCDRGRSITRLHILLHLVPFRPEIYFNSPVLLMILRLNWSLLPLYFADCHLWHKLILSWRICSHPQMTVQNIARNFGNRFTIGITLNHCLWFCFISRCGNQRSSIMKNLLPIPCQWMSNQVSAPERIGNDLNSLIFCALFF